MYYQPLMVPVGTRVRFLKWVQFTLIAWGFYEKAQHFGDWAAEMVRADRLRCKGRVNRRARVIAGSGLPTEQDQLEALNRR